MIVVTGAAGFIGSCLLGRLNQDGLEAILAVDDFSRSDKIPNLEDKRLAGLVHRNDFHAWLEKNHRRVGHIFHLGARTDTTEFDTSIFDDLNLDYSKRVWRAASRYEIPLTYASSAATYGDGSLGYDDDHDIVQHLKPLNPYGISKNDFDQWALKQEKTPPYWQGLKFFNVYGPNEYHKGRMASVVLHAAHQIQTTGCMELFRSHKKDIDDGHQSRDFIYVNDVVDVCIFCMLKRPVSGLYNTGTGKARTFLDLVTATFAAMGREPQIEFIDTPMDIRNNYQYFTQAKMTKLREAGFKRPFTELEEGIQEYVQTCLISGDRA
ncbi:MAG: ADP-glyceromanno-heptose 6-epimerase [Saprospiraceae bacterium]|nr:ADP-glyceromanno-heptose 6-epimerase [Saprospiraceae bacterium]